MRLHIEHFLTFLPNNPVFLHQKFPKSYFSLNCEYNTGHFIGFFPDNLCFSKFKKKITFFESKVNKVPCIIGEILGKINFLGIVGVKTHWIFGQKSQNSVGYAGAF